MTGADHHDVKAFRKLKQRQATPKPPAATEYLYCRGRGASTDGQAVASPDTLARGRARTNRLIPSHPITSPACELAWQLLRTPDWLPILDLAEDCHGRTAAGHPLRLPRAPQEPGLHAGGRANAGAGNRRKHLYFSIFNGVLLSPLPYPHADRMVTLGASKPNFQNGAISYPNFRDWQKDNQTFEAMAIFRNTTYSLTGVGAAERFPASWSRPSCSRC